MIVAFARMSAVGAFGSGGGSNQHCHSGRGVLPSASRARCLCGGGEGPGSHASRAGFERSMTTLRGGSAPSSDKLSFNGVDGDDGRIEVCAKAPDGSTRKKQLREEKQYRSVCESEGVCVCVCV
jgi:hypothetical protein